MLNVSTMIDGRSSLIWALRKSPSSARSTRNCVISTGGPSARTKVGTLASSIHATAQPRRLRQAFFKHRVEKTVVVTGLIVRDSAFRRPELGH